MTARFHPASSPDFVPAPQLRELQSQRLRAVVRRVYDRTELYRKRLDEAGLRPECIEGIDDIARLPFTVKTDLRDTYPFGLFASPMDEIVRLHASSGTTGKPIVVAYNRHDVDIWAEVIERALVSFGLHEGDILQNSYGYGLFTGGLGLHYGGERLGATVIPTSGGNTDRQIMIMKDFGVSAISCTPSYFLHILDRAEEMGVDLRTLPLRAGIFGAEPWTDAMRQHIEQAAGIKAYDIYGLTEIIGPGVGAECHCQNGIHIFEDHFYPEIIDPDSGRPLPDGETRRAGAHHAQQAGHADPAVPHAGRDVAGARAVPVRADGPPHPPHFAPHRRHVHHSRLQRLPLADRDGPAGSGRGLAALPDRADAVQGARPDRGADRGQRPDSSATASAPWRNCKPGSPSGSSGSSACTWRSRWPSPARLPRSEGKLRRVIDQRNLSG